MNKQKENEKDDRRLTSIGVYTDTKERLDGLKVHRRESYDDVINRLIEAATPRWIPQYEE